MEKEIKTYNLLVHQRAVAGSWGFGSQRREPRSWAFLEGAGARAAKKNYREPEPGL